MTSAGDVANTPAHTYAELLSGSLVDVVVGQGNSKRQWSLHRNLLSYHSDYLAAELQTDEATKNDAGNKLELPEDDPKGFELLVKWLYQGKLDDVSDVDGAERKYDYAVACHKLFMLCDRFDMPQLKNVAIDQYRKGLDQSRLVPDADEINDIYTKSPEGSPFRALMARIAARQIMDPDSDRDAAAYHQCFADSPDFAVDLVNAIKSGSGGILFDDPTTGDQCLYHDHEYGLNCYSRGKGKEDGATGKSSRLRPESPPSPPSTPPQNFFQKTPNNPTTPLQPGFGHRYSEHDAANGINGSRYGSGSHRDARDASTTPTSTFKSRQPESTFGGSEFSGGGSPKRQPPKLRRRGSVSSGHPQSPGHV